ncbi:conserved protein of unknown function [Rhodovastum atsumiense]|uniref:DUF4260 family protein n=1 Tax=Rhodovastum atsumiense TaxID=504468 RepID=A0A5M6J1Z4_9PROT|nr:DUF4260 domain-containing protein [Rhodovastum atsumiense]KAA5614623.1 DUF4260 family protein [Rhodovastum atsumiense]CAH2599867.1 conserved protein of unknown function [Rhodovastum atsumiense]
MSRPVSTRLSPDAASHASAGGVLVLLRLENLALAVAAVLTFRATGGTWGLFAAVFLLPDLSMVGYLAGPATGAHGYNLAHTYIAPSLLAALGWAAGNIVWLQIALIWGAHIGVDRALGFGLKYTTSFAATHLGQLKRHS